MKEVKWNDSAKSYIRSLDLELRREIGALIMSLQRGRVLGMPQSKPMKSIHKNAYELRVKDSSGAYRVIYVLALKDKVVIPHAFMKKTQRTPKKDIDLSIKRLKELLNETK
jgi:phage-related protein